MEEEVQKADEHMKRSSSVMREAHIKKPGVTISDSSKQRKLYSLTFSSVGEENRNSYTLPMKTIPRYLAIWK